MNFNIPCNIRTVLDILHKNGFEAYIVGGCVRDVLMGKVPHDYDICTSALPEQIKECFADFTTVDTGIRFGTVVVVSSMENVEVTTYRIDGEYADGRHPESVTFTPCLREDLARRDFTVNALAYSEEDGVIDFFGGRKDIEDKIIRAVGRAEKRFEEDALRIMRALRFASVLGFEIEKSTDTAIRKLFSNIASVSKERIQAELRKLIMGPDADRIHILYRRELSENLEGFIPAEVSLLPENTAYRLGVLFPENTGTFLKKLKCDNKTIKLAKDTSEIRRKDFPESKAEILRLLNKYSKETVRLFAEEKKEHNRLNAILSENPCYSIKQLAVSGADLIATGVNPGPEVGRVLDEVLNAVMDGKLDNTEKDILNYVKGSRK